MGVDRAETIVAKLESLLEAFASGLSTTWQREFEGLRSVLADYVWRDLLDGSLDRGLMGLLIGAISQEVDRLVQIGLPFTQEFCAQTAQSLEELGEVYDDSRFQADSPTLQDSATICYELAVVWYRIVKTTYTGVLPVQSQVRVVQNLIRLGGLTRNQDIFRKAIRELFSFVDDDKFLSLMTQRDRVKLSEREREGLLAYRKALRVSLRNTMVEAINHLHQAMPDRLRKDYEKLERQIVAGQKGPASLLRFLKTVTVIPELKNVEGGRDWLVEGGSKPRYMNMLDHIEEVETALEALEEDDYSYFQGRLIREDRGRVDPESFRMLFQDVFADYHAFAERSGISKLNFWFSLMLHDVGRILLESHHKGGALLIRALLDALGIRGFRQESIVDYVEYHGQWKRFYFLENSPKEVIDYIDKIGEGSVPFMLLEKRRIESIVDLAATGEGRLTVDFLVESKSYRNLPHLRRLALEFGQRRLTAWGGMSDLYEEEILPCERETFFDRYLAEMRVAHSHNLLKALPLRNLLKFHYLCARLAAFDGLQAREVRLTSDKLEDLQALNAALETIPLDTLRARLNRMALADGHGSGRERADRMTRELLEDPGLLLEFKNDNQTISVNTGFVRTAWQS